MKRPKNKKKETHTNAGQQWPRSLIFFLFFTPGRRHGNGSSSESRYVKTRLSGPSISLSLSLSRSLQLVLCVCVCVCVLFLIPSLLTFYSTSWPHQFRRRAHLRCGAAYRVFFFGFFFFFFFFFHQVFCFVSLSLSLSLSSLFRRLRAALTSRPAVLSVRSFGSDA